MLLINFNHEYLKYFYIIYINCIHVKINLKYSYVKCILNIHIVILFNMHLNQQ
jgi:hypothetical protein